MWNRCRNAAAASTWAGSVSVCRAAQTAVSAGHQASLSGSPSPASRSAVTSTIGRSRRIDGVVIAGHPHVVVASQPHRVSSPVIGGTGGSASMPRVDLDQEVDRDGRPSTRTGRLLAIGSQLASWVLKSAGEAKLPPGRNEVSRYRLARSTIPLDSGS